jgi:hypothetical protein
MRVTLYGTRGSIPAPGPETMRYGGNTPAVKVCAENGAVLVLDAGTGIRRLGAQLSTTATRVDILLTHLHMDHIQGLGFFPPLYNPAVEVHLWGPASSTLSLEARLSRYLSPPLFPIHLRDLPSVSCHHVPRSSFDIGPFRILTALVSHPGPTVGYRIEADGGVLCYLSDHEPALCLRNGQWPGREWVSGFDLARKPIYSYMTLNIRMRSTTAMWDGGIAHTATRSNSPLTSARGSLLHSIMTPTTTTRCWTVCRKMRFGA